MSATPGQEKTYGTLATPTGMESDVVYAGPDEAAARGAGEHEGSSQLRVWVGGEEVETLFWGGRSWFSSTDMGSGPAAHSIEHPTPTCMRCGLAHLRAATTAPPIPCSACGEAAGWGGGTDADPRPWCNKCGAAQPGWGEQS